MQSSDNLVKALSQSKVLGPNQLQEVQALLKRFNDPRSLARELIERKILTPYQANQLMQGGGKELVLGPYIILQRLGDNALGQVYKARHQHMNRLVSLTVVREDLLAQPEAVPQFYQEVQAVSQLTHPHLVCAYDAGPIGKTHFFAQEYVEGIDLERLVKQSGPLPVGPAITFVRQAALGLQHAFERRLMHHDLRPVNLLVTRFTGQGDPSYGPDQTPQPTAEQLKGALLKVCNLGLTMLQPKSRQGGAPNVEGFYDFAAPESSQTAKLFDIRSNLYSVGCIFYFLLAGKVPFPGGDSSVRLKKHQLEEPPPLSSLRTDVPRPIEDVIRKLMAKKPEGRFQTPAELIAALGAAPAPTDQWPTANAKSDRTAVKTSRVALPGPDKLSPKLMDRMRSPIGLIVGGIVLFLALALFVWLLLSRGGSSSASKTEPPIRSSPTVTFQYVKKATREDTILATLAANGLPSFTGKWFWIGPFDSPDIATGHKQVNPPETEIDARKTYEGKNKMRIGWKELPDFQPGKPYNLKRQEVLPNGDNVCVYLYQEFEVARPLPIVLSLGSDDTMKVWLNGQLVAEHDQGRGVAADQNFATLNLKPGKNQILAKICNGGGDYGFYLMPRWPSVLEANFGAVLNRDFPVK